MSEGVLQLQGLVNSRNSLTEQGIDIPDRLLGRLGNIIMGEGFPTHVGRDVCYATHADHPQSAMTGHKAFWYG